MAKRERDYRAEYAARKARAEKRGMSLTQARGHARAGERSIAELNARPRIETVLYTDAEGNARVEDLPVTFRESSRASKYWHRVNQLDAGRLSPAEFRRWVKRQGPVGGYRLVSDPDLVLAMLIELGPSYEWWHYQAPGE